MTKLDYLKEKINIVNDKLKGAYVNKINELSSLDYLFTFSRHSLSLFISLVSQNPFFEVTNEINNKNTLQSIFIQTLRNKLLNSCFIEASLTNEDSIVDFKFIKTTDTYDKIEYHLLFELFKGNTNLILLNKDKIELAFRYHSLETNHPLILNTIYLPPKKIHFLKEIDVNQELNKEKEYISNINSKYLKEKYDFLISKLKRKRKSLVNKETSLENDIAKASENLKYKDYGDYFLTIMHEIKKGQSSFTYEGKEIPLKEGYSISDNLMYLYKIYKKAKNTIALTSTFLKETKDDISYIDNILSLKDIYNEIDYEELLKELSENQIIKIKNLNISKTNKNNKNKEIKAIKPYFITYNNHKIAYGKNNVQNNELTFKRANKNDIYLHIANNHGSHVVIFLNDDDRQNNDVDDKTLNFALNLVLYLSKKNDGTIYVAKIKDVKKGQTPGLANLIKYESYFVKANIDLKEIESLVKNEKRLLD